MSEPLSFPSSQNTLSRKCAHCEEEEKLQRKESENNSTDIALPIVHDVLTGQGESLDADTSFFMGSRFNYDFSNVKIHDNDKAVESADAVNAFAYTVGNNIVFNSGQYDTNSDSGKRLLAHELTHVVQQSDTAKRKVMRAARKVGPNQVDVDGPNGVCHATKVFEPQKTSPGKPYPPSVGADIDEKNITFYINWCRGSNKGNITLGADVPAKAKDVLQRIADVLNSGGDLKQVENELGQTSLQPFLDVLIASSGKFSISAHGEINVGQDGVTGGKGSLDFGFNSIDVIFTGEKNPAPSGGGQIPFNFGIVIKFTPGKNQTFDCPVIPIKIPQKSHLVCKCPTPSRTDTIPSGLKIGKHQVKFLYFNYQFSTVNKKLSPGNEGDVDSVTNLEKALRDGYRVKKIVGYTSPEGDLEQVKPGFEGNKLLSEERAIAAKLELKNICQRINLSMRNAGQGDISPIMEMRPVGGNELYGSNESVKDIKDDDLTATVPGDFLKSDREAAHRNPKLVEKLKGLKPKEQVKLIYPLLRRAEIEFEKFVSPDIHVDTPAGEADCSDDILEQAKKVFKDEK